MPKMSKLPKINVFYLSKGQNGNNFNALPQKFLWGVIFYCQSYKM